MKKVILVSLLVLFIAAVVTSCRPHERCPAYGHISKTEVNKKANS